MSVYSFDGIPSDLMSSDFENVRRFKVENIYLEDVEVFRGNKFQVYGDLTLALGTTSHTLLIQTPVDKDVIISSVKVNMEGGDSVFIGSESPTVTVAGSTVTPIQVNRQSDNVSQCVVHYLPTVTNVGSEILKFKLYGTGSQGNSPATLASSLESDFYVLKRDTSYLFTIQNVDVSAASNCFFKLQWFEIIRPI